MIRGGNWNNYPVDCRSAFRIYYAPVYRNDQRRFACGACVDECRAACSPGEQHNIAAACSGHLWCRSAEPALEHARLPAWVKATQALPAEKQIEAVSKKLMELNPGFDGKIAGAGYRHTGPPKIENGVVTELGFVTDNVTDISPVRALAGLRTLRCDGTASDKLAPLSDLSPLQGMHLATLICYSTQVADLSPLQGMPLTELNCSHTQVASLSPLAGMKLRTLCCDATQVSDLSPLRGMPLTILLFTQTPVSDLSPLQGTNLIEVAFTPKNITKGMDVLRQMKSLKSLGLGWKDSDQFPPDVFWKKYRRWRVRQARCRGQARLPGIPPSSNGSKPPKPCLPRSRSKPSARS